jgi:hypothetical protein
MTCPYLVSESPSDDRQCTARPFVFEPSIVDQIDFCTSTRYPVCPLYRQANGTLLQAIAVEVHRAIG